MTFYLVQRLERAYKGNNKKGFDRHFSLEYMGSAEYEFRAPYEALQRMREKPLIVLHHELEVPQLDVPVPVFFVAAKDGLLDKITEFEQWLEKPRSKEQTYFPENLTGLDWRGEPIDAYYTRTVAWWSFDDDIAWTLDPAVAHLLLTAYTPP